MHLGKNQVRNRLGYEGALQTGRWGGGAGVEKQIVSGPLPGSPRSLMLAAGEADVNWHLLSMEAVGGVNESVNPQLSFDRRKEDLCIRSVADQSHRAGWEVMLGCRQGRRQGCRQGHRAVQTAFATFSSICSYSCSCRCVLAWDQAVIMAVTHLPWCLHSGVCRS